jgi:predicted RecB family endonuclease
MDPIIFELLKWGWQGVVIAAILLLSRALGPALNGLLPAWLSARTRREDLLIEALRQSTQVMAETVAALQALRAEVSLIRGDQAELRVDVSHIADDLDLPRPRRKSRPAAAEARR